MNAVRDPQRYQLSFTVGALQLRGAPMAAELYQELGDWTKVRSALRQDNLLQSRTVATSTRLARELVQRLETLTSEEIVLLTDATGEELAQLMWAAACRHYALLGEFAEEVLRERFLLMQPDLGVEHFDAFINRKALWHEELAQLKASTLKRLRSNVFTMLREARLVTEDDIIVPTVLATRVQEQLNRRVPSDIRFFPTRETA